MGSRKARRKPPKTQVRVVTMATGLWHPWSLAWLPNGDMLVTERNGKLRMVRDGKLDPDPVAGVPPVHSVRLSGLMEILPHPKFARTTSSTSPIQRTFRRTRWPLRWPAAGWKGVNWWR